MTYQFKLSKKFLALTLSAALVGGSVVPTFAKEASFTDVEEGKWYTESIEALAAGSIVNGVKEGLFKPLQDITKAEMVKMIAIAKELDTENIESSSFSDVKEGKWYYKYIAAAEEAGIALGDGTGKFEPEKNITRAEVASLLVTAFDLDEDATEVAFTDVKTDDWFYDEVQSLIAAKLTKGTTTTTFSPDNQLTRAEGAEFVYRGMKLIAAEEEAQFIFDVNRIEGEGNLATKFGELGYKSFDNLEEVQQTEVAKLFLLSKGDTEYKTVDEIKAAIDTAITGYNAFLDTINEAADADEMKAALEAIAELFDIEVTGEMATTVFNARTEDGFTSITEIISVLQGVDEEGTEEAAEDTTVDTAEETTGEVTE